MDKRALYFDLCTLIFVLGCGPATSSAENQQSTKYKAQSSNQMEPQTNRPSIVSTLATPSISLEHSFVDRHGRFALALSRLSDVCREPGTGRLNL
jgi:hypothetical protein